MFLVNITKNENLIFRTIKEKYEHPDLVLGPGMNVDLEDYGITKERAERNSEINSFIKTKKVKLTDKIEEAEKKQSDENAQDLDKMRIISEIQNTSALSLLEDMLEYNQDEDIKKAASKRLQELTGEATYDNPELNSAHQNPIIQ